MKLEDVVEGNAQITAEGVIAEVLNVKADERYLDEQTGKWSLDASHPLVYVHGAYYGLGEKIGKFGWSVEKKKD